MEKYGEAEQQVDRGQVIQEKIVSLGFIWLLEAINMNREDDTQEQKRSEN